MYDAIGAVPRVTEIPEPTAPDGGVVVRVESTGLCRSDWHAWAGHDDIAVPNVPGHELAGAISSVGAGVRRWEVGERVTVPFICGCGACEWCRADDAQVCPTQQQPGFTHWGSYAEQVALHAADSNLVRIPDGIGSETAASLGCRFATAYRALVGRAQIRAGEWVAVVGAGGVGLSAVMIAAAVGARPVAIDRTQAALDAAHAAGAEEVVLADGRDVPAAVHDLTAGGAHVAVDAVGSESTCTTSVLSLRRRGRHVQVGLIAGGRPRIRMDRVIAWELDLLGSHGMAAADYPAMLALIERGDLRPQDLISRVVDLAEGAALLPTLGDAAPVGMTMIDPQRA